MALDTTSKLKVIETDKQIETMENPPGIYPGQLIIQDDGKMYYDNVKKARIPISGGGGSSINVVNNLTSTSTTDALSANQGKILNDTKLDNKLLENWHIYPSGQTAILYEGSGYPMDISETQAFKYGKISPHLCNVLSVTDGSFQNITVYLDSPLTVTLKYNGYSDIIVVKGMLHRTLVSSYVESYTFELKGGVISENTYALSFTISAQDVLSISNNEISYTLTENDVMIYSNDNYTNTNAYSTLLAAMKNSSDELVTFTETPMPHVSTVSLKLKNIGDGDVIYWNGQSFCNLSGIASSSGGTTLTEAQLKAIDNADKVLEVGSTGNVTLHAKPGGNMTVSNNVTLCSDTLQLNSTSGWGAIRANISNASTPSYQSLPDYIDSKISSSGGLTEDQTTVLSKLLYTSGSDSLDMLPNVWIGGERLSFGTNSDDCHIDNTIVDGRTNLDIYSNVLTINSGTLNLNSATFVKSWDSLIYSYTDNDGTYHRETLNDYVSNKISTSGGLTTDQQNVLSKLSYVDTTAEYPSMLKSSTNLHLTNSESYLYFGDDPALCYISGYKYDNNKLALDIISNDSIQIGADNIDIGNWNNLKGASPDHAASESLVEYVDRKVSSNSSDTYILYVENNNSTNTSQSISFGGDGSYFKGVDLSSYSVSVSPCITASIMHGVTSGATFMMSSLPKTIVIESYNSSSSSSSPRQTTFTVSNQGSHYSIAASANQPQAGITLIFTKSTNLASASIR